MKAIQYELERHDYIVSGDFERRTPPAKKGIYKTQNYNAIIQEIHNPTFMGGLDNILICRADAFDRIERMEINIEIGPSIEHFEYIYTVVYPCDVLDKCKYKYIDPLIVDGDVVMYSGIIQNVEKCPLIFTLEDFPNKIYFDDSFYIDVEVVGFSFIDSKVPFYYF